MNRREERKTSYPPKSIETDIRPSSASGLTVCEDFDNGEVIDIAGDIVSDLGAACTGLGLTKFGSSNGVYEFWGDIGMLEPAIDGVPCRLSPCGT